MPKYEVINPFLDHRTGTYMKVGDYVEVSNEELDIFRKANLIRVPPQPKPVVGMRSNLVSAVGDSITANNGDGLRRLCKGYLNWAGILSDQKIRYMHQSANPGYTTEKILNVSLPALLIRPELPSFCVVLGGTNDVGNALPIPTITANLQAIYDRLIANNIIPIACTIPPRDGASNFQLGNILKLNAWIRRNAANRGYALCDFHRVLTDPSTANFRTGYASDQIHPNSLGAKIMGKEVARAVSELMAAWDPPLSITANDPANLLTNPLFMADTNADGLPDGWTMVAGNGATTALEDPAPTDGIVGKWFTVARASAAGANTTVRVSGIAGVNPGDKIGMGFRFKSTLEAGAGKFGVYVYKDKDAATLAMAPLYDWDRDTDPHTWYGEFAVPSGVTSLQLDLSFGGAGSFSLAQMTMRNLTTSGIA